MVTDISRPLLEAASRRTSRHPERRDELVRRVAGLISGAQIDRDWDAGEEWARIHVGHRFVALVRVRLPLVIAARPEADRLEALDGAAVLIVVTDLEAPQLTCSSDVLSQAFPEREVSRTFDPAGFSAADLWFATD